MSTVISALHLILFAAVALRVLARPQLNTHTRTAWIFVLLALPFFGVVLYLLIGEIHFGGPERKRADDAVAATRKLVAESGERPDLERWGAASGFATSINGFGVTTGNRGELLDSPAVRTPAYDRGYGCRHGDNQRPLLHLAGRPYGPRGRRSDDPRRPARRTLSRHGGCDRIAYLSQVLYLGPAKGCRRRNRHRPADQAIPLRTMLSRRLDLRNHRKITVIDGRICHCGSQNCADAAFLPKAGFAPWVDIMVRFDGPVAHQMNLLFAQNWLAHHPAQLPQFAHPVPGESKGVSARRSSAPVLMSTATCRLNSFPVSSSRQGGS